MCKNQKGPVKTVIDLSQLHPQLYTRQSGPWKEKNNFEVHMVMQNLVRAEYKNRLPHLQELVDRENFVISHYTGNFETLSFRNDARGNKSVPKSVEAFNEKYVSNPDHTDFIISSWLKGFVDLVGGVDVASCLLQDAGKLLED